MRFRSKVDAWLVVLVVVTSLPALAVCVIAYLEGTPGITLALILVVGLVVALPISLFAATHYTFEGAWLRIRSGPFRWSIPLSEIRGVRPSRSLLSSPALSIDRLRVDYGRGKHILISPEDKTGFLRELEARRPGLVNPDSSGARLP